MSVYTLRFKGTTGSVAGTFKTMGAIHIPTGTTRKVRVRSVECGFAEGGAPPDADAFVRLERVPDVTAGGGAGTAGESVTQANMSRAKVDNPAASPAQGGRDYSAEPTVFETEPLFAKGVNAHGAVDKHFIEPDERPDIGENGLIAVRVAPATTTAVTVEGTITFEAV